MSAKTSSLSTLLLSYTFSLSICRQRHLLCQLFFSVTHSLYQYVGKDIFFVNSSSQLHILFINMSAKTSSLSTLLLSYTFSLTICRQRHLLCQLFFSVTHSLYQYVGKDIFFVNSSSQLHILFINMTVKTPSLSTLLLSYTFSLSICRKDIFFVNSSSQLHILFINMSAKTSSLSTLLLSYTFSLTICRQRHLLCQLFFSVTHSL